MGSGTEVVTIADITITTILGIVAITTAAIMFGTMAGILCIATGVCTVGTTTALALTGIGIVRVLSIASGDTRKLHAPAVYWPGRILYSPAFFSKPTAVLLSLVLFYDNYFSKHSYSFLFMQCQTKVQRD